MKKIVQLPYSVRAERISYIIIHCSAFSPRKAVEVFKQNEVSAHYIIASDGKVIKLVDDDKCAWHAGKSCWQGHFSLNQCSIGIELCSHSLGQNKYNFKQMESLISLLQKLKKKYHIPAENILGHSDIAPTRKPDPGRGFPWKKLAKSGFGLWFDMKNAKKIKTDDVFLLLSEIGYDTSNPNAALCSFCRHFYPSKIEKVKNIYDLLNNPTAQTIIPDKYLINRIKAVAYAYNCKNI